MKEAPRTGQSQDSTEFPESLIEFTDRLHKFLDTGGDPLAIDTLAGPLIQLSLDRALIARATLVHLQRALSRGSAYDINIIPIARFRRGILLRALIWADRSSLDGAHPPELFKLNEQLHNHPNHLLTVGVIGSGYSTDTFEIDEHDLASEVGSTVRLVSKGSFRLDAGMVHLYRAFADAHIQYLPQETSVTLNLVVPDDRAALLPQLVIDRTSKKVALPRLPPYTAAKTLAWVSELQNSSDVQSRVSEIAAAHLNPFVREMFSPLARALAERQP